MQPLLGLSPSGEVMLQARSGWKAQKWGGDVAIAPSPGQAASLGSRLRVFPCISSLSSSSVTEGGTKKNNLPLPCPSGSLEKNMYFYILAGKPNSSKP